MTGRRRSALGIWATAIASAGAAGAAPDSPPSFSFSVLQAPPSAGYVGNAACVACHRPEADTYAHTAHAHTSSLASAETIHGKFTADASVLRTVNPDLYFVMAADATGFTQTAVVRASPTRILQRTERFDLVVGSGRKGQTYLCWDGDKLDQLPVSFWTELDSWVNSPGYPDGQPNFDRPIPPRCLECHGSRFDSRAPPDNRYDPASLVLGISCERCHGPGAAHVARYRASPAPPPGGPTAIVNPAKLPRARQLDLCALCHNGHGDALAPALSYVAGQVLADDLVFPVSPPGTPVDVHAAQVQLLERSRCFRGSPTLSCITCHNVHLSQREPAAFVPVCLTCHQVESCGKFRALGHAIDHKCITCHMPMQTTAKIVSRVNGTTVQPKVRNHQIAIYPDVALP